MQVLTEYADSELDTVLGFTESIKHHLTAAVVSNDVVFLGKVELYLHHSTLLPKSVGQVTAAGHGCAWE